jgi:hypothetical protein
MITLDFSGLHEPRCKNVDKAGADDSDFELWSPHDDGRHGSNNKCFLGQQVTYIRRKQDSECFNGEDFERQTMRVPCTCTEADYECDMNYVRNKGGKCEPVPDPLNRHEQKHLTEKEEDCALEGFYTVTQGYRRIPGDVCYGGSLDPYRKPCTSFAWLSSIISLKSAALTALITACLYYGWPIIEAVILVLPIPDPKDSIEKVKSFAGSATDFVKDSISGGPGGRSGPRDPRADYSSNLEAPPEAFMDPDGDDSDDDLGKPAGDDTKDSVGLDYDSDDRNDDELVAVSGSNPASELIDLGGSEDRGGQGKAAANIPKLSGPR